MTFTPTAAMERLLFALICSATLLAQQSPAAAPTPANAPEFPIVFEQSVVAGKTPVGTKIHAKLAVATLLQGIVIPRNAALAGEVIESVAKTKTDPSRLAIRMDSAQWKNGTAPLKLYLTPWYYPERDSTGQDLQYGPTQSAKGTWNGQGEYPDPNTRSYKPFPGSDTKDESVPSTPSSAASNRPVRMKDVASSLNPDGSVVIISSRFNIKLDKLTIYVLAANELRPAK